MTKAPIILLRGLLREERHWGHFPEYLQEFFNDRSIITLTLAGTGERYHLTSPDSISGMTDDLRNELKRKYPEAENVVLFGLSMGGMITIDWASRFPNEVEHAILMNTSAKRFGSFYERLRWQSYISILKSLFSDAYGQEAETLRLLSNEAVNLHTASDWATWRLECPMSGRTIFNQLYACARFRACTKPNVSTLVMASANDKMVSPICSQNMAKAWDLSIETHPTAGHDITIDDPEWVSIKTKAFLES